MATYVIFGVKNIADDDAMARYNKAGAQAIAGHTFRYLAGPGPFTLLEGGEALERVVLLEFENRAAAEAWYHSEDYRQARKIRDDVSECVAIMIDSAPDRG